MVIFHSYVKLPEGRVCWKNKGTPNSKGIRRIGNSDAFPMPNFGAYRLPNQPLSAAIPEKYTYISYIYIHHTYISIYNCIIILYIKLCRPNILISCNFPQTKSWKTGMPTQCRWYVKMGDDGCTNFEVTPKYPQRSLVICCDLLGHLEKTSAFNTEGDCVKIKTLCVKY